MAGASAGSYLCVTGRGTMQRIDAKPTATLQGYGAFYSPHSSKKKKQQQIFLSLSPPCSVCLRALIVFCGVFYFLNVLIPHLEGELRLSPQLLWQPLFASEKVHLKGADKMCNNMPRHCASLSECSKHGHVRDVMWVVSGGDGGGGEVLFVLFMRARFSLNLHFTTV